MREREQLAADVQQPQRQSVLGIAVYLLRNFRALLALVVSFYALASSSAWFWASLAFAALPVLILAAVFAYYEHQNFTFQVVGEELIIRKGIFFKDKLVVPATRIQSVHIRENLVQRLLGLVALKIDTAGSGTSELEIPALKRLVAENLKQLLYEKKREAEAEEASMESERVEEAAVPDVAELSSLSLKDLLLVGLTENHLRTGVLALSFVIGSVTQYQDFLESYLQEDVDTYAQRVAAASLVLVLVGVGLFVLLSVLISVVRVVLQFYGFKAVLHRKALEIGTGLLNRQHFRIPLTKVQYIKWYGNPLRRWAGFESARVRPSSSAEYESPKSRVEIPALKRAQSAVLAGVVLGYEGPGGAVLRSDAAAYARLFFTVAVLLVVPLAWWLSWLWTPWAWALLAVPPLLTALGYQYGRHSYMRVSVNHVVLYKGWIFSSRLVLPAYKLQAVTLQSNLFIERRGLSHVLLSTAAGGQRIRYLKWADAAKLRSALLYLAASDSRSWM